MPVAANTESNTGLSLNASAWFFAGQVDGSEPARQVPIHTPFRIGRRSNLALTLPCESVSKEHAEITERDGQLFVRDLGSTNGTYINGERVQTETAIQEGDIIQFATVVFRVGCEDHNVDTGTIAEDTCDRALAMMQFDRLINESAVVPFFQPIVTMEEVPKVVGFEGLGRSRLFGLQTPAEMFTTASQLNLEAELSRVLRRRGLEIAGEFPKDMNMFVNTHPAELAEGGLYDSLHDIRKSFPDRKITLEIHEAAITSPNMIRELRNVLRDLDMQLAFDDFGAGQARLIELGEVRPDYLKFDMKLVQGIDRASPSRQQVVAALVQMVNDLGTMPLAEGVELASTHETLCQMGFQLGQGYFYGRPASISKCLTKLEQPFADDSVN
jgi:EAL domain-containing protein (putative c-di-GMP-specific phosphodiesterase class I)